MHIVYKATSPSNKVYIGYTSMSLSERKKAHKSLAFSNNRKQYKFANAIKKYGWDSIKWEIEAKFEKRKDALDYENYCINKKYKSIEKGYNLTSGGEYCNFTKESKRNVAKGHGSKWFRVYCKKSKKLIGTWINKKECAKKLKISDKRISDYVKYKRFSKDYYFIESKTFHSFDYIDHLERNKPKRGQASRKSVIVEYPNGKLKKFLTQNFAKNATGFSRRVIQKYLKEERVYKGYRFYYGD